MALRKRHFCLVSNSAPQQYPHNGPANFTNPLPAPIRNSLFRQFHLRLTSISIPALPAHGAPAFEDGQYVKIHIGELAEQADGHLYSKVGAGFLFPPDEKYRAGDYFHVPLRHATKLPLKFQNLDRLHVRLTDQDGQELRLREQDCTLLWVELSHSAMEDNFTITCSSRQEDYFPHNTLSSFSVPLPHELAFGGYEMAVQQVVLPPHLRAVGEPVTLKIDDFLYAFDVAELDTDGFVAAVRRELADSFYADELRFDYVNGGTQLALRRRVVDEIPQEPVINVLPSPAFTRACGQRTRPRALTALRPGSAIVFDGSPCVELAKPYPVALLSCDIIQPNVLGNAQNKVVQCVPMRHVGDESAVLYEPEQLSFHEVMSRPITSIAFRFLEPDGSEKRLTTPLGDNAAVLIALTFRKPAAAAADSGGGGGL